MPTPDSNHPSILFICTANIQRSLTAERLFSLRYPNLNFKSAGVSRKECERNKSTLCTEKMLEQADIIYVFENLHIERISDNTSGGSLSKITNLDIPDVYNFNDPKLIRLLLHKLDSTFDQL